MNYWIIGLSIALAVSLIMNVVYAIAYYDLGKECIEFRRKYAEELIKQM